MKNYTVREIESGWEEEIEAESLSEAKEQVRKIANNGSYGELNSTIWVDFLLYNNEEEHSVTIAVNPSAPKCSESEHDFQSPFELVGGIESNPGVFGSGGGVIIDEACMNCGCKKQTDTWAYRPDT